MNLENAKNLAKGTPAEVIYFVHGFPTPITRIGKIAEITKNYISLTPHNKKSFSDTYGGDIIGKSTYIDANLIAEVVEIHTEKQELDKLKLMLNENKV